MRAPAAAAALAPAAPAAATAAAPTALTQAVQITAAENYADREEGLGDIPYPIFNLPSSAARVPLPLQPLARLPLIAVNGRPALHDRVPLVQPAALALRGHAVPVPIDGHELQEIGRDDLEDIDDDDNDERETLAAGENAEGRLITG